MGNRYGVQDDCLTNASNYDINEICRTMQDSPVLDPEMVNEPRPRRERHFFEARYWLRDLILAILLAFIVIVFLYQPVQVEGTSMLPRLVNHERIFINKFLYRLEQIQR